MNLPQTTYDMTTQPETGPRRSLQSHGGPRAWGKPFYLTSELWTLLAVAAAILIAAAIADNFASRTAWTLVTVLAAAYIVSRGLAKSGRSGGRTGRPPSARRASAATSMAATPGAPA